MLCSATGGERESRTDLIANPPLYVLASRCKTPLGLSYRLAAFSTRPRSAADATDGAPLAISRRTERVELVNLCSPSLIKAQKSRRRRRRRLILSRIRGGETRDLKRSHERKRVGTDEFCIAKCTAI